MLDSARWTPSHFLQGIADPCLISSLLRMNSVIVRLRLLETKGLSFSSTEDMAGHGVQLYFNENLRCTSNINGNENTE